MKIIFLLSFLFIINSETEYNVEEFYRKVELDDTLDENGDGIDFVFVKTEIKQGRYEVELTDGPGDLYEIKGTDYYVEFRSYFGYAGYGTKGLLIVGTAAWSSKFIKYD